MIEFADSITSEESLRTNGKPQRSPHRCQGKDRPFAALSIPSPSLTSTTWTHLTQHLQPKPVLSALVHTACFCLRYRPPGVPLLFPQQPMKHSKIGHGEERRISKKRTQIAIPVSAESGEFCPTEPAFSWLEKSETEVNRQMSTDRRQNSRGRRILQNRLYRHLLSPGAAFNLPMLSYFICLPPAVSVNRDCW